LKEVIQNALKNLADLKKLALPTQFSTSNYIHDNHWRPASADKIDHQLLMFRHCCTQAPAWWEADSLAVEDLWHQFEYEFISTALVPLVAISLLEKVFQELSEVSHDLDWDILLHSLGLKSDLNDT